MTTLFCLADLCVIPVGTPTASATEYIDKFLETVKESGLKYTVHRAGTTIEGPWNQVTAVIGKAHEAIHDMGVVRVHSDIRIGTRIDRHQTPEQKVESVMQKLGQDA